MGLEPTTLYTPHVHIFVYGSVHVCPPPLTTVSLSMNSITMGGGDSCTLLASPKIRMPLMRMVWSQVGQTVSETVHVLSLRVWNDSMQYGSVGMRVSRAQTKSMELTSGICKYPGGTVRAIAHVHAVLPRYYARITPRFYARNRLSTPKLAEIYA